MEIYYREVCGIDPMYPEWGYNIEGRLFLFEKESRTWKLFSYTGGWRGCSIPDCTLLPVSSQEAIDFQRRRPALRFRFKCDR
jgi:hypothetical protein